MPKYNSFEWEDYRVSIRPLGLRNVFRFLPYLSGSYIDFRLCVKTKSEVDRDLFFTFLCERFDGQKMNKIDALTNDYRNKPTNQLKWRLRNYLVTTGEYILKASVGEKDKSSGFEVIANFSILERDKVVPYILFSLISLAVGAGLVKLIEWLITLGNSS